MPTAAPSSAEQQVLREHQADDAPRARAKRQPHADFAIARARAREHEVGGVAADGEQHQQHHALQDAERREEHHLRPARRPPVRDQLAVMRPLVSGKATASARIAAVNSGMRLRFGRVVAQPAHHASSRAGCAISSSLDPANSAGASVAGTHRSNCSARIVPWKPSGATPTIVSGRSLTRMRLADRGRRAAEMRLPVVVRDHDDRLPARPRRLHPA